MDQDSQLELHHLFCSITLEIFCEKMDVHRFLPRELFINTYREQKELKGT